MTIRETVTIYDSQSEEYHRAFQAFLYNTDPKNQRTIGG